MSKYSSRLLADKKAQDQSAATLSEAHAKASVQQEIAGLSAKLATNAAATEAALGATPFNVKEVLRLTKEKASLAADQAEMQAILASEFSNESAG